MSTDFENAELTMTYKGKVVGIKAGKGTFKTDDGQVVNYDSTKVFLEMPLRGENTRGKATQELKVGKASLYETLRLDKIELPFLAEIEVQKTTNGKGEERDEVIGFRILPAAGKTHQPSQAQPTQAKAA